MWLPGSIECSKFTSSFPDLSVLPVADQLEAVLLEYFASELDFKSASQPFFLNRGCFHVPG